MSADRGAAALRLAYLTTRYPAVSHSFIQREVLALRDLGAEVETFSIHPPIVADLFTTVDWEEAARTFSIRAASPLRVAAAHLHACGRYPRAYLATLRRSLDQVRAGGRPLAPLFHFAEAVVLWRECRRRRIHHLHAHFTSPSAEVAHLASRLGEAAAPGSLSWSFTAHGTDILGDQPGRLAAKVRDAHLVVCVGEFGRAQLMRLVGEEDWGKIRVVRCGLDGGWQAAAPKRRPRSAEAPLRLLVVGRLEREKGHLILLEALAHLDAAGPPPRLTLVGDGSERERLRQRARELGLEGRVSFAGKAGQDTIRRHYAAADLFCLPSLGEGVPVVLMEAMAMELPVVATRVGGVAELVDDGVSGRIVAPGSAVELAAAIAELAADPARCERMGACGRERVLVDFGIEQAANRLFGEFSRLLAADVAAAPGGRVGDGTGDWAAAGSSG
jgi:glycosyltransferase involved in cell wall biosynthesis